MGAPSSPASPQSTCADSWTGNLLVYCELRNTAGGGNALLSTTWYFYNTAGNVTRIVTKDNGDDTHTVTRFEYADNCEAVSHMVGETWETDGGDGDTCPDGYTVTGFARQFRYDEARARYLNRELNPSNLSQVLSDTWSDYDGDEIYGDYTLSGSTATNQRSFQPGIATVDTWTGSGGANTKYYHGDLIGTTRSMSLSTGLPDATAATAYTAFGELVTGTNHRYGYGGEWQYQAHTFSGAPAFLHVGHRYYDPGSGRFLQRDPIGIEGGLSTYAFVHSTPTLIIDPSGLIGESDLRTDRDFFRQKQEQAFRDQNRYNNTHGQNTLRQLQRVNRRIWLLKFGLVCATGYLGGLIGGPWGGVLGAGGGYMVGQL